MGHKRAGIFSLLKTAPATQTTFKRCRGTLLRSHGASCARTYRSVFFACPGHGECLYLGEFRLSCSGSNRLRGLQLQDLNVHLKCFDALLVYAQLLPLLLVPYLRRRLSERNWALNQPVRRCLASLLLPGCRSAYLEPISVGFLSLSISLASTQRLPVSRWAFAAAVGLRSS